MSSIWPSGRHHSGAHSHGATLYNSSHFQGETLAYPSRMAVIVLCGTIRPCGRGSDCSRSRTATVGVIRGRRLPDVGVGRGRVIAQVLVRVGGIHLAVRTDVGAAVGYVRVI